MASAPGPSRRALLRLGAGATAATGLAAGGQVLASPAAAYGRPSQLAQGASGAAVTELRIRIAGWAASPAQQTYVTVDGQFGPGTAAAPRRFQI
ncbi:peptidoglycan-binding protein [Streptomyces filamentosus]|uniref:peptidoglycan-binding domain-containing protein n=1 Tax=Streptomyces filamentosus TaxID=67294 RepID=UPI0036F08343